MATPTSCDMELENPEAVMRHREKDCAAAAEASMAAKAPWVRVFIAFDIILACLQAYSPAETVTQLTSYAMRLILDTTAV